MIQSLKAKAPRYKRQCNKFPTLKDQLLISSDYPIVTNGHPSATESKVDKVELQRKYDR